MPHLIALLTLALTLVGCAGYGWCWLRLLRVGRGEPLRLPYALALGMGTLAYLVLAAGLLGFLTPAVLGGLAAAGWIPAAALALEYRKREPRPAEGGESGPERWLALLCSGFVGLLVLATLASALRPPDGLDWDSLSYHLAAPKIYLEAGRIHFIAYDSHTHFPFTMQMLYTVGLAFGGASAAKLFHWAAGWVTALAVGIWASRLEVRGERLPRWAGPGAAAAFASMPLVLWELGTAYVDLGTALFQFLAFAALVEGVRVREGRPSLDLRHAALAGVLSGFALGTKMTALVQFGLLGLGALWVVARAERAERGAALRAVLAFGLLGLLVGSPWYVKSWLWTNNPVYPFFYSLFPNSFSWTEKMARDYAGEQHAFGLGRGPVEFATSLWDLAVHGRAFYINHRTLVGDKLGSLGPLWAGLLPLLLWSRGLGSRPRAVLLYTLGSLLFWFFLTQQSRYLVPVFAPLAAVLVAAVVAQPSRWLRGAAGLFLGAALLLNLAMHAPLVETSAQLLAGQTDPRDHLKQSLPGLYEATEFLNGLPREEVGRVALYEETRGYYLDRPYFWANPGHHDLIPYDRLATGEALAGELRRFGTTHVLMNFQFWRTVQGEHWYRLVMDAVRAGRLKAVFQSREHDPRQPPVVVYQLR